MARKNRQFYTTKYNSKRLKNFGYRIDNDKESILKNGDKISQADNQFLRTIRKLTNKNINFEELEKLYNQKERIYKSPKSKKNIEKINKINDKIFDTMYIPEYKTVVMEDNSHYKYLFKNGFTDEKGNKYKRLSSSSGQGRNSTVVFCEEKLREKLIDILNNGRNMDKKFSPSKFNAYFGLYGSATRIVSTPRFCVIPDYYNLHKYKTNYVIETEKTQDDIIEVREVEQSFNRFDGMGLITPHFAQKWADELGLDYLPAQWCIRASFIKGMVNVFDILQFCKEKNKGNTIIDTIYKDKNGNKIKVDLKDIDVILTESQFKLWDSYNSLDEYISNCEKNDLYWGVSLYTPKKDKDILKLNYQFIQTLSLSEEDIIGLCEQFIDWIDSVNYKNIYKTLLFLVGKETTEEEFDKFLLNNFNYWVKCLMLDHDLIHDKYISNKIYNMLKTSINNACLGNIIVDGNFQVLVSDPYAFMEYVCGLEVKGLLSVNEYYSDYWNNKNVDLVDGMRSPLTYRSEHVLMNLINTTETRKWYKYSYTGIILNIHGHDCVNFGGSDFDYDILATTNNKYIIKGVYVDELPICYEIPKINKIKFTEEDLFKSDLFTFGSIIGKITNKGASGYALLPLIKGDKVATELVTNRLKMSTKLQSSQIDKAKIGREVKGIPKAWVERDCINVSDEDKELYNSILLNRHPYFFKYLYSKTKKAYNDHYRKYQNYCIDKFALGIEEIIGLNDRTAEQEDVINNFKKYCPVIDSDSEMNILCKYIENYNFHLKEHLKSKHDDEIYRKYLLYDEIQDLVIYEKIKKEYLKFNDIYSKMKSSTSDEDNNLNYLVEKFSKDLSNISSNIYEITDCLIRILYVDLKSSKKDILWGLYGKYIYLNMLNENNKTFKVPVQDNNGEISYLGKNFSIGVVTFDGAKIQRI